MGRDSVHPLAFPHDTVSALRVGGHFWQGARLMSLGAYPLLFLTGLVAGLVDSIAGGGGIISLPVLLNLGLSPMLALGTNKLQASFGVVSATRHYANSGLIDWRACRFGIVTTLLGALGGAWAVQRLDAHLLARIIPWLLAAIVVYSIVQPQVGGQDRAPRLGAGIFFTVFGLVLGFYDGFFGPGAGSFWIIALVLLLGCNFLKATAHAKVMNAASNLASLALFALGGEVDYAAGLVMGAGQILGGRLGAGLAVKRGARFVRPLFLTMVVAALARLIWLNLRH